VRVSVKVSTTGFWTQAAHAEGFDLYDIRLRQIVREKFIAGMWK